MSIGISRISHKLCDRYYYVNFASPNIYGHLLGFVPQPLLREFCFTQHLQPSVGFRSSTLTT
ncbi:hypothetical protein [Scytonema hofmannii]|uniref:hypothetical protein n=1 Tax=Scytonema hofmannii TaxID=34078 RepID=UPI0011E04808|nr:hypothetical protein [Scytonema hofmannii]